MPQVVLNKFYTLYLLSHMYVFHIFPFYLTVVNSLNKTKPCFLVCFFAGCSSKSFKLYSPKEPPNGSTFPPFHPGTMLDRDVGWVGCFFSTVPMFYRS